MGVAPLRVFQVTDFWGLKSIGPSEVMCPSDEGVAK